MHTLSAALAILLLAMSSPVHAAGRLYCAADDKVVKLSIESDVSTADDRKLLNFRGVAGIRDEKVPAAFRHLRFDASMLSQQWTNNRELRLKILSGIQDRKLVGDVELTILTTSSAEPGRFQGNYDLRIETARNKKAPRETVLSHGASIVCETR
ncbi:hypothetical protein J5N58_21200 [Rhizobium cremeum]|uniref:hypothetical protein n=1 Tax=Rhizobium cremeum TaxID=2813827 RepID=UPI000DE0BA62|nr:hypothetical protein [Rhizobium cremeum]MCJ7996987.1 hypothetical protein [Rhizobium cremeum]MCJ8002205.1 hypothetical protein [Rhizobium cremeum]